MKTSFSDANPSQGIAGTIVTAAMMNAVNNHRHLGTANDGDGAIDYAADSGTANAYAIALTPVLTAYTPGQPIWFKAANTNTGASTLNVNGLGAVSIMKGVSQALQAGDIRAGALVGVMYDGTNFQLLTMPIGYDSQDYGIDTGTASAYAITLPKALSAYAIGQPIWFKAHSTNSGPCTINVNGLGAITIVKRIYQNISAGDIQAGALACVVYDGLYFQLVSLGLSDLRQRCWMPSIAYNVGDVVFPSTWDGKLRCECVVAGTSGQFEPTWTGAGTLVTDGGVTWIIDDERDGLRVGDEKKIAATVAPAGYVKRNGALLSRAAYPRLWAFAQASGLLVSDAVWAANNQGCYSSGDGSTINGSAVFRVPDGRSTFDRAADDSAALDTFTNSCNTTSASTTVTVTSSAAMAVGMGISGTGIPAGATITAIGSGTSITISAAATATNTAITLTFTRSIGSYQADKMQGHYHASGFGTSANTTEPEKAVVPTGGVSWGNTATFTLNAQVASPTSDGTNGTPRTGLETCPKNISRLVVIKY